MNRKWITFPAITALYITCVVSTLYAIISTLATLSLHNNFIGITLFMLVTMFAPLTVASVAILWLYIFYKIICYKGKP
jgi:hypothetical protein